MKRLVYAPRVDVYVKADSGVYDISPYVVNCTVNRKSNQVSSATITFRNPDFMFTKAKVKAADGTFYEGPLFHPQDPIIISMTRLQGHPVQVLTGYCDTTPYLQLFPGICTLEASCTLKRLLYRYWDPGLPFVWQFLESVAGWQINPQQGGLVNPQAESDNTNGAPKRMTDGSVGKLLFSVLESVAEWNADNIYIEALPPEIGRFVVKLFHELQAEDTTAQQELTDLLKNMIGSSSYGNSTVSDGNNSSSTSDQALSHAQLLQLWTGAGGPSNVSDIMAAIALAESGGVPSKDNTGLNSDGSVDYGLWQINSVHANDSVIKKIGWENRLNPEANAKMAVFIYQQQGLRAWSTYNNGAYKRFLSGKNAQTNPLNPNQGLGF
jgi:hypothetical protein